MVESQPSKLLVAGSIPVSRSNLRSPMTPAASFGWEAATGGPVLIAGVVSRGRLVGRSAQWSKRTESLPAEAA